MHGGTLQMLADSLGIMAMMIRWGDEYEQISHQAASFLHGFDPLKYRINDCDVIIEKKSLDIAIKGEFSKEIIISFAGSRGCSYHLINPNFTSRLGSGGNLDVQSFTAIDDLFSLVFGKVVPCESSDTSGQVLKNKQ